MHGAGVSVSRCLLVTIFRWGFGKVSFPCTRRVDDEMMSDLASCFPIALDSRFEMKQESLGQIPSLPV